MNISRDDVRETIEEASPPPPEWTVTFFDIIQQNSTLFNKLRQNSTFIDIIRQNLTLINKIRENSTKFGKNSKFSKNKTLIDNIRQNSSILDKTQQLSRTMQLLNYVEFCGSHHIMSPSTLGGQIVQL